MSPQVSGRKSFYTNTSGENPKRLDRALTKTIESNPDLAHLVEAWPTLPMPLREAVALWKDMPEPARQALVSAAKLALAVLEPCLSSRANPPTSNKKNQ